MQRVFEEQWGGAESEAIEGKVPIGGRMQGIDVHHGLGCKLDGSTSRIDIRQRRFLLLHIMMSMLYYARGRAETYTRSLVIAISHEK